MLIIQVFFFPFGVANATPCQYNHSPLALTLVMKGMFAVQHMSMCNIDPIPTRKVL